MNNNDQINFSDSELFAASILSPRTLAPADKSSFPTKYTTW